MSLKVYRIISRIKRKVVFKPLTLKTTPSNSKELSYLAETAISKIYFLYENQRWWIGIGWTGKMVASGNIIHLI